MPITAVLGEQRGDEGKGKFTDMLTEKHEVVARFGGGPNAGHTIKLPDGRDLALHGIPSGIANPDITNVIGNVCVIDPVKLDQEIEYVRSKGFEVSEDNLLISSASHLILPHHVSMDEIREGTASAQGSTKSGIGPVCADKAMRQGVRVESINNDFNGLWSLVEEKVTEANEDRERAGLEQMDVDRTVTRFMLSASQIGKYSTDTTLYLNRRLQDGASVLAEGAQGFLLDVDHGMSPATTSFPTSSGGIAYGLGVPSHYIDRIVGVSKAIQSHVGGGPFTTQIDDPELLDKLHGQRTNIDSEVGTTTGRERRLGHLDLAAIKRAQMVNGTTEMALTKLDWVPRYGEQILICTGYLRKGKVLEVSPDAAYKIEQSKPIYEQLPAWKEDVSGVRHFDDLPVEAQDYIHFIEDETGKPITMIGVGPGRDEVIYKDR